MKYLALYAYKGYKYDVYDAGHQTPLMCCISIGETLLKMIN